MRQFHAMMHTQLIVFLALVVAAVTAQSALANASTSAYSYSRSSLRRPRHGIGSGPEHDVAEIFEVRDSYAVHGIHHRKLQQGVNRRRNLPFCPRCRLFRANMTHTYRMGNCRMAGQVLPCFMKKNVKSTTFFAIIPPVIFDPAALNPLALNRTSTASASQTEEILIVADVSDNSTSTVLPVVGCFSDADCELSASGLAAVNGITPISRGGVVTAACVGNQIEDGVPGTCMCSYRVHAVASSTAGSGAETADQAGGRGGRQRRPTAQSSQTSEADTPVFDICVRQASFESISLFSNSNGSAILINNTADGKVKLDVVLAEILVNVPDDYEYDPTADSIVDGISIMSSATPFSQAEMAGDDEDGSMYDIDDDSSDNRDVADVGVGSSIVVTPDPTTPQSMPPADALRPAPTRQAVTRAPAATQTPTPTPVSKPRKRVLVVKVNKDGSKSIFVKEIDVSMRVRDT